MKIVTVHLFNFEKNRKEKPIRALPFFPHPQYRRYLTGDALEEEVVGADAIEEAVEATGSQKLMQVHMEFVHVFDLIGGRRWHLKTRQE